MTEVKTEETVEIKQEEVVKEPDPITEETLVNEGLSEDEIALAKEHGMVSEKKEEEPEKKVEDVEDVEEDDKNKEEVKDYSDLDSFDKVHDLFENKPDEFRQLPKNVKALYHNSKGLYKKYKTAEERAKEIESKQEFEAIKEKGSQMKLKRLKEMLKDADKINIEDLEKVIDEVQKEEIKQEEKIKDDKDDNSKYVQEKLNDAEKFGNAEYDNFDDIINMAKDVIALKPRYQQMLSNVLMDKESTDKDVVDTVIDIAKLNDKFGKSSGEEEKEVKNEKVDRMVKNSAKKPSSAAVGGGNGKVVKTYEQLTPEDLVNMDYEQYKKLPENVVKRLKAQL